MIGRLGRVAVRGISHLMCWISGACIAAMVCITCLDVILRKLRIPVDFPFEVVGALAGIVIAFALPLTTLAKTHVAVEYLETRLSRTRMKVVKIITRWIGIALFLTIGWNALGLGNRFLKSGQHSSILEIPEYPFPYALAVGCFVTCLVLFSSIFQNSEDKGK